MRMNIVTGMIGQRGCGKTTATLQGIQFYQSKRPNMKILVVSRDNHPLYRDIPAIKPEMIRRWKGANVYRIFGDTDPIFNAIKDHLFNALVIFEDATNYIEGRVDKDVKNFIIDSKQHNLDIIFQFHGFADVPPKLIRYMDVLDLFKCDHPEYRKRELGSAYPLVLKLWEEINKSKNPYIHKSIDIR